MLPLGHVTYTWAALLWSHEQGVGADIDFRLATVAAILPDLVDKPLSLTLFANSGTSQGLAHTLLGHLLTTSAIAHLKPALLPYALIVNSHLLADQMWKYPHTLFFPFSGRFDSWQFMGTPAAMLRAYARIVTRPTIVAIELLGLGLLARAAHRHRLLRPGTLLRLFKTGRIAPQERRPGPCAS